MTKFSAPQQSQLVQIGAFLRDNREKQAKSLEDIAICTYIRPQLLNGLEAGNPDLLPEPIFVQGFIRRYAEALGLDGIELSQQFTVTSIPSTPRPEKQAPLADSATTRLTRISSVNSPIASQILEQPVTTSAAATPIFSPLHSIDHPAADHPAATDVATPVAPSPAATPEEIQLEKIQPEEIQPITSLKPELESTPFEEPFFQMVPEASEASNDSLIEEPIAARPIAEPTADPIAEPIAAEPIAAEPIAAEPIASLPPIVTEPSVQENGLTSDSFNFEPVNADHEMTLPSVDQSTATPPIEPSVEPSANLVFNDDLPAAFTTEATSVTPSVSRSVDPVGVEMGKSQADSPKLMPFVIGGIAAVLTVGAMILFNVLGRGSSQPNLAGTLPATEQPTDSAATSDLPTLPTSPATEPAPPVSTAPIYVKATATSASWVSIIADGDRIFEGTLQPGDSKLWEAKETLSIYSGNAGGLTLAANGGAAAVMGAAGQPEEKIFSPQ